MPPLNGLRAFEAAARHLSFQNAARELHVTPGAISQQIKKLEDILQTTLFHREGRTVTLTDRGRQLLPGVSDGFDRLDQAVQETKRHQERQHINISVTPSFATKWLVQRLENWTQAHPEIDIRISANLQIANFGGDGIDLAVRFGGGRYDGLESTLLMPESFVVVCSPAFIKNTKLATPEDMATQPLLHVTGPVGILGADWRQWLKAAGAKEIDVSRGLSFDDTGVAILAAINGQGILLARRSLVEEDMSAGRLVMPFDVNLPLDFAWYIVTPPAQLSRPEIRDFRDWLLAEAQQLDT